jgi:hypothetical protein
VTRSRLGLRALAVALAGSAACITHDAVSAYPLYRSPRLGRDQVALLFGLIGAVDGKEVPQDRSTFELLPGCHVVTTQTKLLAFDATQPRQGSVVGTLHPIVYAINMQAGHSYVVERQIQRVGGRSADVATTARDVGADGQSSDVRPAQVLAEVRACLAFRP